MPIISQSSFFFSFFFGGKIREEACIDLFSKPNAGNFNKLPTSFIFSHVSDEADLFVPPGVITDSDFDNFVNDAFPPYTQNAGVTAAIEAHYPTTNYSTTRARLKDLLGESSFYCNVRYLSDAYAGKNYNLQYSVTPGLHATDLLPTFYDLNLDLDIFGKDVPFPLIPGFGSFAQAYQSYLVSHAQTGDPNTYKKTLNIPPAISWPKPGTGGDAFTGVLNAGNLGFSLITDGKTATSRCQFWREVAAAVTDLGGMSFPPQIKLCVVMMLTMLGG